MIIHTILGRLLKNAIILVKKLTRYSVSFGFIKHQVDLKKFNLSKSVVKSKICSLKNCKLYSTCVQ
jgi:hypothetical protein